MKDLTICVIQYDILWEDPEANRVKLDVTMQEVSQEADIVVLCEMFTTGFSMSTERISEPHDPDKMITLNWMRKWASLLDAVICGSLSISEDGKYYNRLYWVRPDGTFSFYNKRHTFTFAREDEYYERGKKRIIEEYLGWKICPLICYDLRFPVWSRNKVVDGVPEYDVLLYSANWPKVRVEPWKKLMLARAIENQVYTIGCNRVGTDGNGIEYSGESAVINPRGEIICQYNIGQEGILMQKLSWSELEDFRSKFPVLNDADNFSIE